MKRLSPRIEASAFRTNGGNGCQVRLVYLRHTGSSSQRSFTVNLAPGTSLSDSLVSNSSGARELVRPAAWIDTA
jgi:hypothetical protein